MIMVEDLNLAVLIEHKGKIHQVILTKEDERHVSNLLANMFLSTGRNFQVMEDEIEGVSFKKGK